MNSVTLIGRLTKDVEFAYTQSNTGLAKFTLAVARPKKNGEDQGADFIRVTAWGKTAEVCDRYLFKGREVAIQGKIQTGNYKDKDGKTVYTTDVIADNVEFIGGNNAGTSNTGKKVESIKEGVTEMFGDDVGFQYVDDGIPF